MAELTQDQLLDVFLAAALDVLGGATITPHMCNQIKERAPKFVAEALRPKVQPQALSSTSSFSKTDKS